MSVQPSDPCRGHGQKSGKQDGDIQNEKLAYFVSSVSMNIFEALFIFFTKVKMTFWPELLRGGRYDTSPTDMKITL